MPADKDPRPDRTLDARGLRCPLPYLKAKLALEEMGAGLVLEVLATDPESRIDLRALCEDGGHELVVDETAGGELRFLIRRG